MFLDKRNLFLIINWIQFNFNSDGSAGDFVGASVVHLWGEIKLRKQVKSSSRKLVEIKLGNQARKAPFCEAKSSSEGSESAGEIAWESNEAV